MPLEERRKESNQPHRLPKGSGLLGRINSILARPLWGFAVPPGTRVNPDLFPEEEYPTWCLKCGYLLRGLTENRCPECGQEFDRGRLLVQEYASDGGRRADWRRPHGKGAFIRAVLVPSCGIPLILVLSVCIVGYWELRIAWIYRFYIGGMVGLFLPWIIWEITRKEERATRRKRRRILDAIKADLAASTKSGSGL